LCEVHRVERGCTDEKRYLRLARSVAGLMKDLRHARQQCPTLHVGVVQDGARCPGAADREIALEGQFLRREVGDEWRGEAAFELHAPRRWPSSWFFGLKVGVVRAGASL
jgi:hypothetical protein